MVDKKRDTSKKRNSILDAAVLTFQKEGYENASMDRIAEVAKASKRTVYNHFVSKEALFQEVILRFFDQIKDLKQIKYNPALGLKEQLTKFADAKMAMISNPTWLGLIKVTMGVFIRDPKLAVTTMEKAAETENILVVWLNAAKEDGKMRFEDAEMTANVFWSMVSGALFWPLLFQEKPDWEAAEVLKKELIQVFLARYKV